MMMLAAASSASGWVASWLPAGFSIAGKLMHCPSTVGTEVALADVRQHFRAQVDAVQYGAGAPQGYLVGGRARNEIVVSLFQHLPAIASCSKMFTGSLAITRTPDRL